MATTKDLPKSSKVRAPRENKLPTRERNRMIAQSSVKPLQVMMDSLADSWKYAQAIDDPLERIKAQQAACLVAEKVAPYLHPKLQATTIKGDADNPLAFSVSLPDSLLLMAAVRGKRG
jgi:hypothetical protein